MWLIIQISVLNGSYVLAQLIMLIVTLHLKVIICQNFKSHTYSEHLEKTPFVRWKLSNFSHDWQTWNHMWNKYYKFYKGFKSFQFFLEHIFIFQCIIISIIFMQIYSNPPWYTFLKNYFIFIFYFIAWIMLDHNRYQGQDKWKTQFAKDYMNLTNKESNNK